MNGIIVIDKPQGYTSFDVVAVMRGLLKQKKIGHSGTLDPMATGVLPILVGSAAKAQSIMPVEDKEYLAEFKLGISTDTLDITGNIIEEKQVNCTLQDILKNLEDFKGEIYQVPPMYSAVKVDGKRLYELARKGEQVKRDKRKVTIHNINLLEFNEETKIGLIKVACSKGTYIRTICDELGKKLKCGAVLTKLRRTKACGFTLNDAITLDEAKKLAQKSLLQSKAICIDKLFMNYKQVVLSKIQENKFRNGVFLNVNQVDVDKNLKDNAIFKVYNINGDFLGLAKFCKQDESLRVYKMFCIDRS